MMEHLGKNNRLQKNRQMQNKEIINSRKNQMPCKKGSLIELTVKNTCMAKLMKCGGVNLNKIVIYYVWEIAEIKWEAMLVYKS